MQNVTCQDQNSGSAGKVFWVDQPLFDLAGAAHGAKDASRAAMATGAAPAASVVAPHGNHGDNQQ